MGLQGVLPWLPRVGERAVLFVVYVVFVVFVVFPARYAGFAQTVDHCSDGGSPSTARGNRRASSAAEAGRFNAARQKRGLRPRLRSRRFQRTQPHGKGLRSIQDFEDFAGSCINFHEIDIIWTILSQVRFVFIWKLLFVPRNAVCPIYQNNFGFRTGNHLPGTGNGFQFLFGEDIRLLRRDKARLACRIVRWNPNDLFSAIDFTLIQVSCKYG